MSLLLLALLQAAAPVLIPVAPSAAAIITTQSAADPASSPLAALAAAADDQPETAKTPQQKTEKVRKVVVRAIRNCPEAKTPDEIVVCSKDRGVAEAYRIPKLDPRYDKPASSVVLTGSVGSGQGLGSGDCSAAGTAGQLGCALGEANAWGAERKAAGKKWGDKN